MDQIAEEKLQNFGKLAFKIYKSEGLRIALAVFLGIFFLLFLLPFFFKNDALKFQIEQKVTQIAGADFSIHGDVSISFVPSLAMVAEDVVLKGYHSNSGKIYNIYAKKAQIKLPIFKFFDHRFAKKIILTDALLESFYVDSLEFDHDKKFQQTTDAKSIDGSLSQLSSKIFSVSQVGVESLDKSAFPEFEIINGSAIFYDKFARKKEVSAINLEVEIGKENVALNGNFISEDVPSNFRFFGKFSSKSRKDDSFFEIVSPALELKAKGKFTSENRGIFLSDFSGKIDAEILDLKSFYKAYFSSDDVIFQKLKNSTTPLKISSNLDAKAGEISLPSIQINSDLVSGDGEVWLNLNNKFPLIDISLNLEQLVLDGIWSSEMIKIPSQNVVVQKKEELPPEQENSEQKEEDENQETETKKIAPIDFELASHIRNFDLTAEIKIKNVDYLELQLTDVDLYATISNQGQVMILPLIFHIPNEGVVRANGVFDSNLETPKFVGKVDIQGKNFGEILKWLKIESQNVKFDALKNYAIYFDSLLLPGSANLSNVYLNLNDQQSEISGEIKIEDQEKNSKISTTLRANKFKVEDYFFISGENAYFSPGSLLKKLLWLNESLHDNLLVLQFDDLLYKNKEYLNQELKMRFGRGYFILDELKLDSQQDNLKASLTLDISDKQPRFELNIFADKFSLENPPTQTQQNKEEEKSALDKITSAFSSRQNWDVFDRFFALPSLEDFDGKISIDVASMVIGEREIKNFKLGGNLKNGALESTQILADLYEGSLKYSGMMALRINKIFNGNLTFTNVALQPFLSDAMSVNKINGLANFAANITAASDNKNDFVRKLTSEIKFSVSSPSVDGYGLSDLIKKMFSTATYQQELAEPEKILTNSTTQTLFNQASCSVKFASGSDGKLRCDVAGLAVNGILTGAVDLPNRKIDLLLNSVFLTGNRQKQIPINIATSVKGEGGVFLQSSNLNQVRQYLGLPKLANSELAPVSQNANQDKTVLIPAEKKQ